MVLVPSPAIREAVYRKAAESWERLESRVLPRYGGRPWKVFVKISDPTAPAAAGGGSKKKPLSASPYFVWNESAGRRGRRLKKIKEEDLLRLAAWPEMLLKIPEPPRFPGYLSMSEAAVRSRRRQKRQASAARRSDSSHQQEMCDSEDGGEEKEDDGDEDDNVDDDGGEVEKEGKEIEENQADDDGEEEESGKEEEEEESEEDEDEQESDPLLDVESTALSRLAYEERSWVPLPSVSIRWVSPLNKSFSTRKSAWENAVQLCAQECLIEKVLKGKSARGSTLKASRPTAASALKAGKLRFERDGLWVVGQEESWQQSRLDEALEDEKGETKEGSGAPPRQLTPLAYYLRCNRRRHLEDRKAELQEQQQLQQCLIAKEAEESSAPATATATAPTSFTYRDAERELRTLWRQLTDEERKGWAEKCKLHRERAEDEDGSNAATRRSSASSDSDSSDTTRAAILWVSYDDAPTSTAGAVTSSPASDLLAAGMVSPSPPTVSGASTASRAVVVTPESRSTREPLAPPAGKRAKQPSIPTIYLESTRWRMTPEQCRLCYNAGMEHFDQIMRTVQARDLSRELQDGFDLLRERGRGRYDMELPAFEVPPFTFLSDLYKAPWMPIVREILGKDVVLIHKGMFLALPGADRQVYHQDGLHLTTQYQREVHAINVFIPVVDMTAELGPTQFCLGSHLLGNEDYDERYVESPLVKAGTPIIFDYRLGHRGLANASHNACRPIVYCTYARAADGKEFRDTVNFSRKRYHKIGNLVEKAASREERARKREQSSANDDVGETSVEKRLRL